MKQIPLLGDDFDPVWAFEDGAGMRVFFPVCFAITVEQALDKYAGLDVIVLAGEDVVVVGQQTVGDDGYSEFLGVRF